MAELERIETWIARQVFTARGLKPRTRDTDDLPAFRYNGADAPIEACAPDAEGAFRPDGRGLDIALLGTGLPADCPRPFSTMDLYPIDGAEEIDATEHDRLNYDLLRQWLPRAHYHVFILRPFADADKGLGVSDRHIDAALEGCRELHDLDFIISSLAPSHHRFLGNINIFARAAQEEPVISFWPTGNWLPGTAAAERYSIGSVNRNIIVAGQVNQIRFIRWHSGFFRISRNARYDREHELPHFWAPGPSKTRGATGSSYSTVPVALAWIRLAQLLKFLGHHKIVGPLAGDLTDYIRHNLKNGKVQRRRIVALRAPHFAKTTKGIVNFPTALRRCLLDQLESEKAEAILAVLYRKSPWIGPRRILGAVALILAGGGGGAATGRSYHLDLWAYYAPLLDPFHFSGWTYTAAITQPHWVVAQTVWSTGSWAFFGLVLGYLLARAIARFTDEA